MPTDLEKIAVLGELIDFCDFVEKQEEKANSYKECKKLIK